jgi:glycosyltransferase involved in cell wall biosynthesis
MIVLTDATGARLGRLVASILAVARARRRGVDVRLAILDRKPGLRRALFAALPGHAARLLDGDPQMPQLRAAADVFLQLLDADDGTAALDAMASGLPVLLPLSDGAAALVTDGVQGWILRKPGSATEIAWRLRSLGVAGLRGAMAAQARALAAHRRTVPSAQVSVIG